MTMIYCGKKLWTGSWWTGSYRFDDRCVERENKREGRLGRGTVICRKDAGVRLNMRRRGSLKELVDWIEFYENKYYEGTYCRKRARKLIDHFDRALDKLERSLAKKDELEEE